MRIFTILLNPENKEDEKIEVLDTSFIPEENTILIVKHGNSINKYSVVKTENVLERDGNSADFIFNVFVKKMSEENNVN